MHSRITVAAVAVLGLLATTTACGADAPPGPAAAGPSSPAYAQVTRAEAEKQLAAYVDMNNRANASLDDKLLAHYETGAALVIDQADYESSRLAKKDLSTYKPFNVVDVSYFPVRTSAYPRWFLLKGHTRNLDGTKRLGGWKYQLFRQEAAGGPWLEPTEPGGFEQDTEAHPELATDADGLATEVAPDASGLLIAPRELGANYAAALTGKPLPAKKAQFVGKDPWPTSQAETRVEMKHSAKFTEQAAPATKYPTYALRTKDGGALVFTTVSLKDRFDVIAGHWVTDTSGEGFLKQNTPYIHFMEKNYLMNLLAYVPPAGGSGKLRVIGSYVGMISASGG